MPTLVRNISGTYQSWEAPLGSSFPKNPLTLSNTTLSYTQTRSTPVRRHPPSDLFLGGTPWSVSSTLVRGDTRRWLNVNSNPMIRVEGQLTQATIPWGSVPWPSVSISRESMYNKIRESVRGDATNLAQMLAEYRQTAELFASAVADVGRIAKAIRKRRPDLLLPRKGWKKGASSELLRFRYGVEPLVSDVNSAVRELKSSLDRPLYKQDKVKRRAKGFQVGEISNCGYTGCYGRTEATVELSYTTTYRAYFSKNLLVSSLAAHGFLNPFAVGYELTPFSFVLDWWINLGDVLASLDNLVILDSLWVIDSTFSRSGVFAYPALSPGRVGIGSNGQAFYLTKSYVRSAPAQISRVQTLSYKPSVSRRHIENGIALLTLLKK